MLESRRLAFYIVAGSVVFADLARAQPGASPPTPTTLEEAVAGALAHHPRLAGAAAKTRGAIARVDEATTTRLPSAGLSGQLNRSTGNTVPGTLFPTTGFAAIAGAPVDRTAWQSGVGAWVSWDLLSLSRETADVDVAVARRALTEKETAAEQLDVAYAAADAFLRLLEAEQAVTAAGASVDRAQVFVAMVKPLVDQDLRPGVDVSRAESDLAAAQTQLARAEQAREVARAQLAAAIGAPDTQIEALPGHILDAVEATLASPVTAPSDHPLVQESDAAIQVAEQVKRQIDVQSLPRVELVASAWLRGSGLENDPPLGGLLPDQSNWAAGVVVTWSVLDGPAIHARKRAASADKAAVVAERDEVYLTVASELRTATAFRDGAIQIAKNTPRALASARATEQQAVARYRAGLAAAVDVADAERLLAQAELDDVIARVEVRRADLLVARAAGDLGPFLTNTRGSDR